MTAEPSVSATRKHSITINKVGMKAPLGWLAKGLDDLMTAKIPSLVYGFAFALIGITLIYFGAANPVWSTSLTTAFLLIGPFLAIGLYDLSRQIEEGNRPCLLDSIKVIKSNLVNIGVFVFVLGFMLMIWLRVVALIAAIVFNDVELITKGWSILFSGGRSVEFILFFTLFGLLIALVTFSISVVSMPMLLHRRVDVVNAIFTSLRVVFKNPLPMLFWAFIIVVLINIGFVFLFIGLTVMLPLIGHASWHAYKELVSYPD